jgi:translation initiation factor 3 subunit D
MFFVIIISVHYLLTLYSFVSRVNPRSPNDHVVLGVLGYKPRDFAAQMNLNIANGWGIVRTIVDMVLKMDDGKYVLVKDPNKNVLRLYQVPADTFEDDGEGAAHANEAADDDE